MHGDEAFQTEEKCARVKEKKRERDIWEGEMAISKEQHAKLKQYNPTKHTYYGRWIRKSCRHQLSNIFDYFLSCVLFFIFAGVG